MSNSILKSHLKNADSDYSEIRNVTFDQLPNVVSQLFKKVSNIESMMQQQAQQPAKSQDELLTIKETSELLGLSVPTLYSKVSRRELPVIKPKGTKRLYFSRSELMEFIHKGRIKTIDEVQSEAGGFINIRKGKTNE